MSKANAIPPRFKHRLDKPDRLVIDLADLNNGTKSVSGTGNSFKTGGFINHEYDITNHITGEKHNILDGFIIKIEDGTECVIETKLEKIINSEKDAYNEIKRRRVEKEEEEEKKKEEKKEYRCAYTDEVITKVEDLGCGNGALVHYIKTCTCTVEPGRTYIKDFEKNHRHSDVACYATFESIVNLMNSVFEEMDYNNPVLFVPCQMCAAAHGCLYIDIQDTLSELPRKLYNQHKFQDKLDKLKACNDRKDYIHVHKAVECRVCVDSKGTEGLIVNGECNKCESSLRMTELIDILDTLGADLTKLDVKETTKNCPDCNSRVYKDGGCDHITCKCKFEFCWKCGSKWRGHDSDRCKPTLLVVDTNVLRVERQSLEEAIRTVEVEIKKIKDVQEDQINLLLATYKIDEKIWSDELDKVFAYSAHEYNNTVNRILHWEYQTSSKISKVKKTKIETEIVATVSLIDKKDKRKIVTHTIVWDWKTMTPFEFSERFKKVAATLKKYKEDVNVVLAKEIHENKIK